MMTIARRLAAVAICAGAVFAIYRWCVQPYQCNIDTKRYTALTKTAYQREDAAVARTVAERVRRCLEIDRAQPGLWMVLAADEHIMQRHEAAIEAYRNARHYSVRPEIELNLGYELIESGRRAEALEAFVDAVRLNPLLIRMIEDPLIKRDVNTILTRTVPFHTNLLRNADFRIESLTGKSTSFTGKGHGGDSAAAQWFVANSFPGTTTTELLDSNRPGSNSRMIHIVTTGKGSGIVQVWGAHDLGPDRAVTSLWVRVQRGAVAFGSGNAEYTQAAGVSGPGTLEWQHLEATNTSCPVNRTVIFSLDGPADFFIESPAVMRAPGKCP